MKRLIPIGVSNRHIHLSEKDLCTLFGEGYQLTNVKNLTQPGEFAADETVTIVGPKGQMNRVRILGPIRNITQVEISKSDSYVLGVNAPIRMSGDINGTPGLVIIGPKGRVALDKGVIIAMRHIHMNSNDAREFGVKDKEIVQVKTDGDRGLIFDHVVVRVSEKYALDFHIDTDEANAAGLKTGDMIELVHIKQRELLAV
ncbi:phosphate propanoyltransferase [Aneurinibacillus terranovensis]|uniref:phosphate propanoyltransferase n=1 Tax=Aneurinibacillus terranovensis TaxID=278991 RepID=UPI0003F67801|nr:phosphate propanoyltransferase [Aneurinibacillus terranovensis]